jgi:hypothetical protein
MKAARFDINALQMQIIRMVAEIRDEEYLRGVWKTLQAKASVGDRDLKVSEEEAASILQGLRDADEGHFYSTEEVQDEMRALLGKK